MLINIINFFEKFNIVLIWVLKRIITVLSIGMVTALFLAVFSRYVIQMPITGAAELARYLMVWMAFLAGSVGMRRGVHVGLSFLREHVTENIRNWLSLTGNICVLIFFVVVTYQGFQLVNFVSSQTSPALEISMGWIYSSVPVGGFIFIIFLINNVLKDLNAIFASSGGGGK